MAYPSLYDSIQTACAAALASMPALTGVPVATRKKPSFEGLQDSVPQVIVACREDLAETVVDETFEDGAILGFEVYIGIVAAAEWTDTFRQQRLYWREQVRLALWAPHALDTALGAPLQGAAQVDCKYDPKPAVPRSTEANVLDESWQMFTYVVSTLRATTPA